MNEFNPSVLNYLIHSNLSPFYGTFNDLRASKCIILATADRSKLLEKQTIQVYRSLLFGWLY